MEQSILGKQVWVEIDGQRRRGTVSSEDHLSVVIREDDARGVAVFPKTLQGTRWGLLEDEDGAKVK